MHMISETTTVYRAKSPSTIRRFWSLVAPINAVYYFCLRLISPCHMLVQNGD